ncbi:hypothetical protein N7U66_10695 [Lacinutrix neustonica]|uniref:PKD domain-containing protein n=1 Tax=Lacinutrix neustonica TaxID=2980107 RepID=A0A9E8MY37_9FLAO|nr:hypothetical protein [Lacinutrix neustonica]WAC03832.1 hypothetical protein N7U66_10695 [Lacinutrix neustonica]
MKTSFITLLFFSFSVMLLAQENMINDTLTRTATITYKIKANTVEFSAVTPPLNQIAGAPKAFYNHFWEFGDGDYSKEEKPLKKYKKEGEYEVKYWATNMYDTGKPPTTRPEKLKIDTVEGTYNEEASMTEDLTLIRNREPMPSEDMVIVMSYKNSKTYATNGKLLLYFNEAKYKADNFELVDSRTYHNEKNSPVDGFVFSKEKNEDTRFYASSESSIQYIKAIVSDTTEREDLELTKAEAETTYKNTKALEFSNMKPNEERHVFFTFKTTP